MRVKDFVKMYRGMSCVEVEIYAIVIVFNEEYHVLVREFVMDYAKVYSERKEKFMYEEVLGFEIESGKLKLFIRGCE
jgi:hypothetical protein